MSYELYVGNYPSDFTRRDVSNLFKEFPGVTVRKFFKKDIKSYSFLLIDDIETVLSVVKRMNNAAVSGRKLKVRASKPDLQEYITLLLNAESDGIAVSQDPETSVVREKNKCAGKYSERFSEDKCTRRPAQVFEKKVNETESCAILKEDNIVCKENKCSEISTKEFLRDNYVDPTPFVPYEVLRSNTASQLEHERKLHEKPETNSYCSSTLSMENRFDECSNYSNSNYPDSETASFISHSSNPILPDEDDKYAECVWLSVTNFPIGTSIKSIYTLFDEYQPLKVFMICNYPRPDLKLTEAYVCFLNRDIADDVILNFDNTIFRGRIMLVNDIEDLTVMSELLNGLHF